MSNEQDLTFTDHTIRDASIYSTRTHHVAEKSDIIESGRKYLHGLMSKGKFFDRKLGITARRNWPVIAGTTINLGGGISLNRMPFWTLRGKSKIADHTALFIPAFDEPDWVDEDRRTVYEALLVSLLALSEYIAILNRENGEGEICSPRANKLAREITAQRPVLVTVPIFYTPRNPDEVRNCGTLSVAIASALAERD